MSAGYLCLDCLCALAAICPLAGVYPPATLSAGP
jgi:hypothetical protein